jgi:hypothetical protein
VAYITYQNLNVKVPTVQTFEEWREIDGVKVPWKVSITASGRPYMDIVLLECRMNSGLNQQELRKQAP